MCACEQPTINGQPGYRWQPGDASSVRAPMPPALAEGDQLIFDEPGRCGGLDSHCHHYRVVEGARPALLVCHGGGEVRIRLSNARAVVDALWRMESNERYWLLNAIFHAECDGRMGGRASEGERWRKAAIEKRIKVRKVRGSAAVKVEITE